MKESQLIKLLKTGNFTIIYWDNADPTVYKGKWDYNKESEKDEYYEMEKHRIDYQFYNMNGYVPDIVELLAKALGGKTDSI